MLNSLFLIFGYIPSGHLYLLPWAPAPHQLRGVLLPSDTYLFSCRWYPVIQKVLLALLKMYCLHLSTSHRPSLPVLWMNSHHGLSDGCWNLLRIILVLSLPVTVSLPLGIVTSCIPSQKPSRGSQFI